MNRSDIEENIRIFYSPFEDPEEAMSMLESIDIKSLDKEISKVLHGYLMSTTTKIFDKGNGNKKLEEWCGLAKVVCNNIKYIKSI